MEEGDNKRTIDGWKLQTRELNLRSLQTIRNK